MNSGEKGKDFQVGRISSRLVEKKSSLARHGLLPSPALIKSFLSTSSGIGAVHMPIRSYTCLNVYAQVSADSHACLERARRRRWTTKRTSGYEEVKHA